jgi:NTF2 fold immunity protein
MQLLTRTLCVLVVVLPITLLTGSSQLPAYALPLHEEKPNYVPTAGYVPNEKVAARIAEAVLSEIYGDKQIRKQLPFNVTLKGDVWFVNGYRPSRDFFGRIIKGGTAKIEISKTDGKILRVIHGV